MIRKIEYVLLAMGALFLVLLIGTVLGLAISTMVKVWEIHEILMNTPIVGIELPSVDPEAREM